VVIQQPTWFGLSEEGTLPVRIAFLTVGIWWLVFAAISFRRLPQDQPVKNVQNLIGKGIEKFKNIWNAVSQQINLKTFLLAFFLYSAGVQTVIMLASLFGSAELNFGQSELIVIILLLQLLAIAGVYLFAKVSDKKGNITTIVLILLIWIAICVASFIITDKNHFYIIVAFIGLVMGGVQSLSRSTYAKLLPTDTDATASYFSFYDVLEKLAIVSGTLVFGFVDQITGGMRNSILFLTVFFLAGIFFLFKVKMSTGQENRI
jgi:UMF1 family MFS transporter